MSEGEGTESSCLGSLRAALTPSGIERSWRLLFEIEKYVESGGGGRRVGLDRSRDDGFRTERNFEDENSRRNRRREGWRRVCSSRRILQRTCKRSSTLLGQHR